MSIIHRTTLVPSKLELLAAWLPAQPWYLHRDRGPELTKAGGFRLDDPQGEVGIEFMVAVDGSGDGAIAYHIPMTYRSGALDGASDGLIGNIEHGVLGQRWVYDGTHDPVLVAQLVALIQGEAQPQAQSVNDAPDPTVASQAVTNCSLTAIGSLIAANGPSGTDLRVETTRADAAPGGQLTVRINRILQPVGSVDSAGQAWQPCVIGDWKLSDGAQVRGVYAAAQYAGVLADGNGLSSPSGGSRSCRRDPLHG
jgi:Maltokinase N-terminal cap domain